MLQEAENYFNYSKIHAKELQEKYLKFFQKEIGVTELETLANLLGIFVERTTDIRIKGRLEISQNTSTIFMNAAISASEKLMAIGHELAHWILLTSYPDLALKVSTDWKEKYANNFAYELCVPFHLRNKISEQLNSTESALALVNSINKFKIPHSQFLRIMFHEVSSDWSESERKNIWIIAKLSANRYTKLEPKLRVSSVYYNKNKYYIPENHSLGKVINNISPLSNLEICVERKFQTEVNLQIRNINAKPIYSNHRIISNCSVVRLLERNIDSVSQFIILINANDLDINSQNKNAS